MSLVAVGACDPGRGIEVTNDCGVPVSFLLDGERADRIAEDLKQCIELAREQLGLPGDFATVARS